MVVHKTPVTLTASERQAQLAREGRLTAPNEGQVVPHSSATPEEIRARLYVGRQEEFAAAAAHNLVPEHRFPKAATELRSDDEFDGCTMPMESSKIKPYDRDPRRSINPLYEEIKGSIRIKGILNPLTVTRRPGTLDYFTYGGGNTRLKAIQELSLEHPGNRLYSHMTVVYRAWRGEADVIAAHLIENEARAGTTFWDKAAGLISLRKELESELGTSLSSNDTRLKAAALGWKVSRETVQLYDFATERLHPVGPWLTFNAAHVLKDRIGALLSCMKQLDIQNGPAAFSALLAAELALQADSLKTAQEANGFDTAQVEADAASICTSLEERVATANGIAVPELRQMLAMLATNPQASAAQLREAAKCVVARSAKKALSEPRTDAAATQIPLPTPMLAAVRPPTSTEPADDGASQAALLPGLPSIDNQGELPTELAVSDARLPQDPAVADPQQAAAQAAQALLEALRDLAASTYNTDLFVVATRMPLGYFMEPPPGPLQPNPTSALPEDQQIRLRRAGWQLLTTLSSQLDQRCCNERCLPEASRWLQAVRLNGMAEVLLRCGITVTQGRVQLDAECLFYILTEPRLLGPAVLQVLRALAIRRGSSPNLLPPQLELITALRAMAA